MSDCRKCAEFDWCVENEDCGLFKPKMLTNADKIRCMTDEELARWFDQLTNGCDSCPNKHDCTYSIESFGRCDDIWLGWLKQEVSE